MIQLFRGRYEGYFSYLSLSLPPSFRPVPSFPPPRGLSWEAQSEASGRLRVVLVPLEPSGLSEGSDDFAANKKKDG